MPDNLKVELYNFGTGSWAVKEDYPLASGSAIGYFDMVYIAAKAAYYVIGGRNDHNNSQATIAMFKDGAWSQASQLNTARYVSYSLCV